MTSPKNPDPKKADEASRPARSGAKPGKARVDQLLVERGIAESRARAQALVLAGLVFSGESKISKPGQTIAADAPLEARDAELGGWHIDGIVESPITGPEGNVEFLIAARRGGA